MTARFQVRDLVSKVGGDYTFDGTKVAVFNKLSRTIRLVEDDRRVLYVYSEKNLKARS